MGFNQNIEVNNGSIFVTKCDIKKAYPENFEDVYAPIKAGDILIAVNDISVTSTSHQRAAEMIRELGRPVTLTLERLPQIFDAENVRKILDEAIEKEKLATAKLPSSIEPGSQPSNPPSNDSIHALSNNPPNIVTGQRKKPPPPALTSVPEVSLTGIAPSRDINIERRKQKRRNQFRDSTEKSRGGNKNGVGDKRKRLRSVEFNKNLPKDAPMLSQTQDNESPASECRRYERQRKRQRKWEKDIKKHQSVARKIQFDDQTHPETTNSNKDKPFFRKRRNNMRSSTEINGSQPQGYPKMPPTPEGEDAKAKNRRYNAHNKRIKAHKIALEKANQRKQQHTKMMREYDGNKRSTSELSQSKNARRKRNSRRKKSKKNVRDAETIIQNQSSLSSTLYIRYQQHKKISGKCKGIMT